MEEIIQIEKKTVPKTSTKVVDEKVTIKKAAKKEGRRSDIKERKKELVISSEKVGFRRLSRREKKAKKNYKRTIVDDHKDAVHKAPFSDKTRYYNGVPISKVTLGDASMEDIVLNCQILVARLALMYPKWFHNNGTAPYLSPSKVAAYCVLYVLQYAAKRNLINFGGGITMPKSIFADDYVVPAALVHFCKVYWDCVGGAHYARRLNYNTDWSLTASNISRNYVATSISAIQDVNNNIFANTLGVYNTFGNGQSVDTLTSTSQSGIYLFTNTAFYQDDQSLGTISAFFGSCGVSVTLAGKTYSLRNTDGSGFAYPVAAVGTVQPYTWNNSAALESPFAKFDADIAIVIRPNYSVASLPTPLFQDNVKSLPFPIQPNGSNMTYGAARSATSRTAEIIQKYWYLGLQGVCTGYVKDFKKSFRLYGIPLPQNFADVIPVSQDFTGFVSKALVAYFTFRNKLVPEGPYNTNEIAIALWYIIHLFAAKVQYCGQMDLTYGMGAFPNVCSFQNFICGIDYLSAPMLPHHALLIRSIGITSNGGKIYVPFVNFNFSSGSVLNATSVAGATNVVATILSFNNIFFDFYPTIPSPGGTPQFPNVNTSNLFMAGGIPAFPNGGAAMSEDGIYYSSGFNAITPTWTSFDSGLAQVLFYFSGSPYIVECFTSFCESFTSIDYSDTLAMAPIINNYGGVANNSLKIMSETDARNGYTPTRSVTIWNGLSPTSGGVGFDVYQMWFTSSITFSYAAGTADIAEVLAIGARALYNVNGGTPPTMLFYSTIVFSSEMDSSVTSAFLSETSGAKSAFLNDLNNNYKKHRGERTNKPKIETTPDGVSTTDCLRTPMNILRNVAAATIKSPKTPIAAKGVCEGIKFLGKLTPAAALADWVDCKTIEKGIAGLQNMFVNSNKTIKNI